MRRNGSVIVLGVALATLALGGCSRAPGHGADARAHFLKITEALKTGSSAGVFSIALSPSHQADLNGLLIEARELVTEADFNSLKEILTKAGPKISSLCTLGAVKFPALSILASKAKDLPRALGLDTFEKFNASDARGILEGLDKGVVADLLKSPDLKARIDTLDVRVVAEEGDWAKLRFASKSADGTTTEELVDVISNEGNWLPTAWVSDWKGTIEGLRAQLAQLKEARKQDPELVQKGLQDLARLLDDPAALMSRFSTPPASPSPAGGY